MKEKLEIIDGRCVIPHGVKEIEEYEFHGNDKLREIVFPETLCCIGRKAFKGFWNLKEVYIPRNAVKVGEEAFAGCCNLDSIKFA